MRGRGGGGAGPHQSHRPAADVRDVSRRRIPASEIEAYTQRAIANHLVDQQVRDIDIGKANVGIGVVYRGKLDTPGRNAVAEHDQVSARSTT